MHIYFIVYFILVVLSLLYKIDKNFLIIYSLILSIFYSFSINIGLDWPEYKSFYDSLVKYREGFNLANIIEIYPRFELGYLLFSYIISRITDSYHLFILISNVIAFIVYFYTVKLIAGKDSLLVFSIFTIFYGYKLFVSTLRQNIAVAFVLLGIVLYIHHNKKCIFAFCAAFLFHYSAIIFIPVIILYHILNRRLIIVIASLCFLLKIAGIDISYYLLSIIDNLFRNAGITMFTRLIIGFMHNTERSSYLFLGLQLLFLYVSLFFIKPDTPLIKLMYTLILCSLIVGFQFGAAVILSSRLRYYWGIGYIYIAYKWIVCHDKFHIVKPLALAYCMALFLYGILSVPGLIDAYVPYQNIAIEGIEDASLHFDYSRLK